jgi:hypothetical protein
MLGTIAAVAAAAGVVCATGGAAGAAFPTIYVQYTTNCTFTVTDDAGKAVTSITPGQYQVAVSTPVSFGGVDLSGRSDMTACKGSIDFDLTGPGVAVGTTLNDGDGSFDLLSATFRPSSTYVAVDNNQPTVARASFTTLATGTATGSAGGTTTTATGSAGSSSGSGSTKTAVVGTLKASVGSTGALKLTYKGKSVSSLKAGKYTVTVVDTSTHNGFILRASGKPAVTVSPVAFVGSKSVDVDLKTGQWYFAPSSSGKKTYFIVTAPSVG